MYQRCFTSYVPWMELLLRIRYHFRKFKDIPNLIHYYSNEEECDDVEDNDKKFKNRFKNHGYVLFGHKKGKDHEKYVQKDAKLKAILKKNANLAAIVDKVSKHTSVNKTRKNSVPVMSLELQSD
jgi:hypothetical protein